MSSSFASEKKYIRRIMESDSSDNGDDNTFTSRSRRHGSLSTNTRQKTTMKNHANHNCSSSSDEDDILEYRPFSPSTNAHKKQSSFKSHTSSFQDKLPKPTTTMTTTTKKRKLSSSPASFSYPNNSNDQETNTSKADQRKTIVTRSATKKKNRRMKRSSTSEMLSSSDEDEHQNQKQEKIHKKALRKVQLYSAQLPTKRITKCSQLVWYKEYTDKYTTRYHPSRICDASEAVGLPHLNTIHGEKKKKNVLIQFLEYPLVTTKFPQVVDSQSLLPYYGIQKEKNKWCPDFWNKYQRQQKMMARQHLKQKASRSDLQACFMILQQLLQHAQDQEEQVRLEQQQKEKLLSTPDDHNDVDSVDSDELDEPYTQALNPPKSKKIRSPTSDGDSSSSDEGGHPYHSWNGSDKKNKEPLRPGDVVTYYSPIFVWGDKRGLRTATVLSTDPHRDPILVLDNGEILPNDTQIKRIKINDGTSLYDHPGIFRTMTRFIVTKKCLKEHGNGVGAGFQIASARVGQILQHNQTKFQQHVQQKSSQDGGVHGPTDIFRTTKFGKRLSSSSTRVGGTAHTTSKKKEKKKSISSSSLSPPNSRTSKQMVEANDSTYKRKSTNKKQKGQIRKERRHNLINDDNDDNSWSSDSSSESYSKHQRQQRYQTNILQARHPYQQHHGRRRDVDNSLRNNHHNDPSSSSSDSETPIQYAGTTPSLSKQRYTSSIASPQQHELYPNNASLSKKFSDSEEESVERADVPTYPDYQEKQQQLRAPTLPQQTQKHHSINSLQDDKNKSNSSKQTIESCRRKKSKTPAHDPYSSSESSSSSAEEVTTMLSSSKPQQRLLETKPTATVNRKKIDPSLNSPYSSSNDTSDSNNSALVVKVKKKKYSKGKHAGPGSCVKMVDSSDSESSSSASSVVKKPKRKRSRKGITNKTKFPSLEIQKVVSHKNKSKGRSSTSSSMNISKDDDKEDDDFLKGARKVVTKQQKSLPTFDCPEEDDDSVGMLSSAKMSSMIAGQKHPTNSSRDTKKMGFEATSSSSGTMKTKKAPAGCGFSLSLTKHNTTFTKKARTPLKSSKRVSSLSAVREKRESLSFSSDSDNSVVASSSKESHRQPSPVGKSSEMKLRSTMGSLGRGVEVVKSHDESCSPEAHKWMNHRIAKKADESLTGTSKKEKCLNRNGSAKKTPLKRKRLLSDTTNSSATKEYTPRTKKQNKRKDGAVKIAVGKENAHEGEPTSQLSFDASMSESSLPHDCLHEQDSSLSSKKKTKKSTIVPKSSASAKRSQYSDSDNSLDGGRWIGKKSFKKKKDVSELFQNKTTICSSPDQVVVRESIDTLLGPPPSSGMKNNKKVYGRRSRPNRKQTLVTSGSSSSTGRTQAPVGMIIIPGNSFRS